MWRPSQEGRACRAWPSGLLEPRWRELRRKAGGGARPISCSTIVGSGLGHVPVVDASVVVDWVSPDADDALPAVGVLARLAKDEAEVLAPRLLLQEVANVLLSGVRGKRWSGVAADRAFALLRDLPIRLAEEPEDLHRAWELARRYDEHPIYDMLYVALAERHETQFVTADRKLRNRLIGLEWIVSPEQFAR